MPSSSQKSSSPEVLAAAARLVVDSMTAEVVSVFRARDIRAILLKGPSFVQWLYSGGSPRSYVDADLLISQGHVQNAQEALRSLGFRYGLESQGPGDGLPEGLGWQRGQGEVVDLHETIRGAEADPALVWQLLSQITEIQRVGGLDVEVLEPAGKALHVALHAADPGPGRDQALGDLSRALSTAPLELWRSAGQLAARLDAIPAFVTGLRLLPNGAEVVDRLGLSSRASTKTLLVAAGPVAPALSLEELSRTWGLRAKLLLMARMLFPSKRFMRDLYPLARRGPIGLTLSYCWRIISRALHLPAAIRALRRARQGGS